MLSIRLKAFFPVFITLMNESGREFALHVMVALIKEEEEEEGSVAVTVCVCVEEQKLTLSGE